MRSPSLFFQNARCLALVFVLLSISLCLAHASQRETQFMTQNRERISPDKKYTWVIPAESGGTLKALSNEVPTTPHRRQQIVEEVSDQLDTYIQQSHLSSTVSHGLAEASEEPGNGLLVMAYYPDWLGSTFTPAMIDFGRFHWIDFAFAVPDAHFALKWDDPSAPQTLRELVAEAHKANSKVKLSIGGWTGSKYFSLAVATNSSRSLFVDNIVSTYVSFQLDGIDIDWEYPGKKGDSGSHFHSKDSANFLSFLQLLRERLPSTAFISAAVETTTFTGARGKPMTDLSEFAKVLDWVLIMNYDVWGSSEDPGPNAPLHDACNNSTQPDANAVAAYNAWTSGNFPAHKLVLGLPSYGYLSSSTADHLRTRSKSRSKSKSVSEKGGPDSNFITAVSEDGSSDSQIQFREMLDQGILKRSTNTSNGEPVFIGSGGFIRIWDGCSDTPYLRSISSGQIITYDDPESLGMKAAFAKGVGMRGVNLFDIHGDTDEWDLVDSVIMSLI